MKPFDFAGWGFQMPALGVAEREAQLAEIEGNDNLAKWWRGLADADKESKRSYETWERLTRVNLSALLARAEKDDGALLPLGTMLSDLLAGLHALAAHGNKMAGRWLMNAVHEAVGDFGLLATAKPELFREWARGAIAIPGHISRNKEKQADNQRLLKQLEQGEACRLAILPTGKRGKKWKFQDRANALAVRLVNHIEAGRTCYELHKLQAQHAGRELPGWLHAAMKLEPFSAKPKTWQAWARVGWQVLAEISPDGKPGQHPAFYDAATRICNVRKSRRQSFPKKQKPARRLAHSSDRGERFLNFLRALPEDTYPVHDSPSIAKEDIAEAFFGAFELIATGTSQRTKRRKKASPDT